MFVRNLVECLTCIRTPANADCRRTYNNKYAIIFEFDRIVYCGAYTNIYIVEFFFFVFVRMQMRFRLHAIQVTISNRIICQEIARITFANCNIAFEVALFCSL